MNEKEKVEQEMGIINCAKRTWWRGFIWGVFFGAFFVLTVIYQVFN